MNRKDLNALTERWAEETNCLTRRIDESFKAAQDHAYELGLARGRMEAKERQKPLTFEQIEQISTHLKKVPTLITQDFWHAFFNAIEAAHGITVTIPKGWKLVPEEPTDEMCKAGYMAEDKCPGHMCDNHQELHRSFSGPKWEAMLNAAPKPPGES